MTPNKPARQTDDIPSTTGAPADSPPPLILDFDLACQHCRYNLRGLSGDPVRCPECGTSNTLGEGEPSEADIAAQFLRTDLTPGACVCAMLVVLPTQAMIWLLALLALRGRIVPGELGESLECVGAPALLSLVIWYASVERFRTLCGRQPGWRQALLLYHVYGLGISLTIITAVIALYTWLMWPAGDLNVWCVLLPAVTLAAAIKGARRLMAAPYARLQARIHTMQRPQVIAELRADARRRSHEARLLTDYLASRDDDSDD